MEDNKDIVVNNGETGDVKPEKTYTEQDIQNSFNADSEKINELTNTNASLTNEIKLLKAQIQVDNSNCKKEFSKFVTSEVMSLVNDTTDFERALKDYKKNNPQYFGETVITKTQTAPSLNNGTQPQTTSSIMNNILRGARNN